MTNHERKEDIGYFKIITGVVGVPLALNAMNTKKTLVCPQNFIAGAALIGSIILGVKGFLETEQNEEFTDRTVGTVEDFYRDPMA